MGVQRVGLSVLLFCLLVCLCVCLCVCVVRGIWGCVWGCVWMCRRVVWLGVLAVKCRPDLKWGVVVGCRGVCVCVCVCVCVYGQCLSADIFMSRIDSES